ncbi:energy-coupling factor ABC transporter permease [Tepidibacter mesophilus]|nr:energy-coupling factor ABC transporter permease [Tepidibacter mesophilus]
MKRWKLALLGGFYLILMSPIYSHAMHIMEGFLPPMWAAIWAILTLPFVLKGISNLNKIFKEEPNKKLLIALVGAFTFVLSALKLPSVTGSCSHPTGVGLGAILFGPSVMAVVGIIVLLFQAILLAHGGLSTLGANAFSMAVVGPLVSYIIFKVMKKNNIKSSTCVFAAAALGDLATYVTTAIQLGVAFPDPTGGMTASLVKFLSIFAVTQLPLAVGEGLLTAIVYNLLVEYKNEGGIEVENI